MSFKLIASHLISEHKFSMIVTRTLHPSYRSLKNTTIRRKLSISSESQFCCSLSLTDRSNLPRSYSTNHFFDVQPPRVDNASFNWPSSDLVNQYLKSFSGEVKKGKGSLKKFEPCYRPLYPSKKYSQPTYKIPRKLPYVPAVFQPRKKPVLNPKNLYRNPSRPAQESIQKRGLNVQWPPLYKSKRRDAEQKSNDIRPNTGDLPSWLLPLYSCKSKRTGGSTEARYSGGAFHRRMEFLEGIRMIRDKQKSWTNRMNESLALKEVNKVSKKPEQFISKRAAAVNDLKRKIGEMYAKMKSTKRAESSQRGQPESEIAEGKSYSGKEGQLEKAVAEKQNVGNSIGTQVKHKTSNSPKVDLSPNPSQFPSDVEKSNYKPFIVDKLNPQTIEMSIMHNTSKDKGLLKKDTTLDGKEWSVEWLKLRINDMLANEEDKLKKITSKFNEVVGVSKRLSGTVNRHRGFQENEQHSVESMMKSNFTATGVSATEGRNPHPINSSQQLRKYSGRSYVSRRCLSTFSVRKGIGRPKNIYLLCRRSSNSKAEFPVRRSNWINRVKMCFKIKKSKGVKVDDWKNTPRQSFPVKHSTICSPSPVLWTEKVVTVGQSKEANEGQSNPAILNAEQRIMASVNRMEPTQVRNLSDQVNTSDVDSRTRSTPNDDAPTCQQCAVDTRLSDIEKKVRKAELKMSILPLRWPNVKTNEKRTNLPELRGSQDDEIGEMLTGLGKKEETGYEWLMNNKRMVEDIKDRARQCAGKPLVPPHVKQSIEEYKLPLRAQISQYRKTAERKSQGLYLFSTTRRWYTSPYGSCCFPFCNPKDLTFLNFHSKLFQRSNIVGEGVRYLSSNSSNSDQTPKNQDGQSRGGVLFGSEFYKKYALRPMYGDSSRDEPLTRLAKDPNLTKNWANMTKARAVPQPAPLTSPNKMIHKSIPSSSASLKKQVDDLKRLIRKSKELEREAEKIEEVPEAKDHSGAKESYESKLRKLVRAAQTNSKKIKSFEPKYHAESNSSNNSEKIKTTSEPVRLQEPQKPVSKTFTKLVKDSRMENKSVKTRPQVTQSVSLESFQKNKKPFSSMYSRLRSFVESVRRKSTQDSRNIPSNQLKGSISLCSLRSSKTTKKDVVEKPVDQAADVSSESITVELQGGKVAPKSSVQLWKAEMPSRSERNAKEVNDVEESKFFSAKHSTHGELMSLFSRAKELIAFQSQLHVKEYNNLTKVEERSNTTSSLIGAESLRILSPEEITHNLLSKPKISKPLEESHENHGFWPLLSSQSIIARMRLDDHVETSPSSTNNKDLQISHEIVNKENPNLTSTSENPEVLEKENVVKTSESFSAVDVPNLSSQEAQISSQPSIDSLKPVTSENCSLASPQFDVSTAKSLVEAANEPHANNSHSRPDHVIIEARHCDNNNCRTFSGLGCDRKYPEAPPCKGLVECACKDESSKPENLSNSTVFAGNQKSTVPQSTVFEKDEDLAPLPTFFKSNEIREKSEAESSPTAEVENTMNVQKNIECNENDVPVIQSSSCEQETPSPHLSRQPSNNEHPEIPSKLSQLPYSSAPMELKSQASTYIELLAKDPTINPEIVKKLKLPVHREDQSEKTWCTQARNK